MATMTIEAASDGDVFLNYVEHVLGSELQRGDIVAMNNLAVHKVDVVPKQIAVAAETVGLFAVLRGVVGWDWRAAGRLGG